MLAGLVAICAVVGLMLGGQEGGYGSSASASLGGDDRTYSYYHDRYFDSESYSPQYERDGAVDSQEKWEYDGPYNYGGYGSKGMKQRTKANHRTDPLYTTPDGGRDAFDRYAAADPAGEPIGHAWLQLSQTNYSPYAAGYSNPYSNRIRRDFGLDFPAP
jgi:hypothetical protein